MTGTSGSSPVQGSQTLAQVLPQFLRRILVAGELLEPFRSQLPSLGATVIRLPQIPDNDASLTGEAFDAILYNAQHASPHDVAIAITKFQSGLAPYGLLYLLLQARPKMELVEIRALIESTALSCYEIHQHQTGSDNPDTKDSIDAVIVVVSNSYDPLLHAREAAASGDPRLGDPPPAAVPLVKRERSSYVARRLVLA